MNKDYFFCGIGGSGMLPLAMIVRGRGHHVAGSDRALDQGSLKAKFDYLRALGVELFAQDGSGLTRPAQILVASAAVEETVPDVVAAKEVGAARLSRAQLLSQLFNGAREPIGVAGTSGKSTTTGMIAQIFHSAEQDPTVMNGAVMNNFVAPDRLFASALVGEGDAFIAEVDESDGSIKNYNPSIAVLNNIALDHKSMDELRQLFGDFVAKAKTAVLNADHSETAALAEKYADKALTYSIDGRPADICAVNISAKPMGIGFKVHDTRTDEFARVMLQMPGRHNVSNALAAICAARAAGISLEAAAEALNNFTGIRRRMELVGSASGVTIFDDFGHNPDKITASLNTLHDFDGRLLVMFQPHGFGPLKKMKREFIDTFTTHLGAEDVLIMPEPLYLGGTVDRAVTSQDLTDAISASGKRAESFATRPECGARLKELARPGDRIVIMGARDDTLSVFARELLAELGDQNARQGAA